MIKSVKSKSPTRKPVLPIHLEVGSLYDFIYTSDGTTVRGLVISDRGSVRFLQVFVDSDHAKQPAPTVWGTDIINDTLHGKFYLAKDGIEIHNDV